ncbi:uncharacterized protein PAC_05468 [Phialocephala subalpina]|uniref:Heterokaryon incompatibility domain-containing protein n=1 Tax=Phialocephala subalpina TaxID=576137 RepID=A0A1L7WS31_9HELO|nr:uncharacterized protein PAC_05468 [Phialocephala subalpina]
MARKWFTECHQIHEMCRNRRTSYMPSRLIEIEHQDRKWRLKLHPTSGKTEPYAALSYCWGGDQPIKTKKATLQNFLITIPYLGLPKTIHDAVITTSELGLRFLWIDCLCIIQDDVEDKAKEIAQMPHIYSQAAITISASRPASVHEGFLEVREVTNHPELVFELPFQCPNGDLGSVTLFRPITPEGKEPLDQRAWALQERILSSRILEFGTRQSRWICPETKGRDGYSDGWRVQPEWSPERRDRLTIFPISSLPDPDNQKSLLGEWDYIIDTYTRRGLTEKSDRILAVSGIAERFNTMIQGKYVAGLWLEGLPESLLWKIRHTGDLINRPTIYQGPSWSWVAVNGNVDYRPRDWASHYIYRIQILSHFVVLAKGDAPYGAVILGRLEIRGRIREARWVRPTKSWSGNGDELRDPHIEGLEGLLSARLYPDALEKEFVMGDVDSTTVHLLDVSNDGAKDGRGHRGLALRDTGNGCYSRLGIYQFAKVWENKERQKLWEMHWNWFEQCEPRLITLE